MIPPKSNRKVQRDFDKDAYKARLCKSWTATLARDVQETTVFIRAQARKKLSTTTSATATDKNSHDLFAHGLRLAVDCAQPDREAERAWAAQTTVPPGFDAVPRPPGASSGSPVKPQSFATRTARLAAENLRSARPASGAVGHGPAGEQPRLRSGRGYHAVDAWPALKLHSMFSAPRRDTGPHPIPCHKA